MTLIFTLLVIIIFLGMILIVVKLYQLKKIGRMDSNELINYVTKNNDDIKISIAVIKDNEVSYQVYGKNHEVLNETKYDYEIGSISKTFVGLLLSRAIEDKKISLKSSISDYLNLDNNQYYPTIERLLTHTSGYKGYYFNKQMVSNQLHQSNDFFGISKSDVLRKVKRIKLKDKDYKFKYSNFGIAVVGMVLEQVYHKDFVTLMNDFIESELRLKDTDVALSTGNLSGYWNWKNDDGYIPAGAIISNIEAMAQYLTYNMSSVNDYISNTHVKLKSINGNNFMYEKMNIRIDSVGITWMMDEKNDIIWHNGGTTNFNSYIGFNKNKGIGVVILANASPIRKVPMTVIGTNLMRELSDF